MYLDGGQYFSKSCSLLLDALLDVRGETTVGEQVPVSRKQSQVAKQWSVQQMFLGDDMEQAAMTRCEGTRGCQLATDDWSNKSLEWLDFNDPPSSVLHLNLEVGNCVADLSAAGVAPV